MLDPRELLATTAKPSAEPAAPLGGTRTERLQRLQVGLFGILAMVLLVGLADIVISRAEETKAGATPEAAPTIAQPEPTATRDPLADAGVVPDVPQDTEQPGTPPETGDVPAPVQRSAPLQ